MALLSFRTPETELEYEFPKREFCLRYAKSIGGVTMQDAMDRLAEMEQTWVRHEKIVDEKKEVTTFRILEAPSTHEVMELQPDKNNRAITVLKHHVKVSISKIFAELAYDIERATRIRLDMLSNIGSPLASATYLYIPSRAWHHSASKPFSITLTKLLGQLGNQIPKHKSGRKQLFTQNKKSVILQLDGAELIDGSKFRVSLVETANKDDFNLNSWVEKPSKKKNTKKNKIKEAWLATGRSEQDFDKAIKEAKELDFGEEESIQKAGAKLEGNEDFYVQVAALIGRKKFRAILADLKTDKTEGKIKQGSTTKLLIYRLMEALKSL